MSPPVIGISASLETAGWDGREELSHLLPRAYVNAVQQAGGVAVVLPTEGGAHPTEVLDLLDGLLLSGGADIDPGAYGASPHAETKGTVPERDAFELALVAQAIERDLPTIGICRGMQLLNIARGGTLHQHIPGIRKLDFHRRTPGDFRDADHLVRIAPGSLAARVIPDEQHAIKSHHHQAVDEIGTGLGVTAWSVDDDLPEAIELAGSRFILGVQWHPEADPSSPVVGALVEEARSRAS